MKYHTIWNPINPTRKASAFRSDSLLLSFISYSSFLLIVRVIVSSNFLEQSFITSWRSGLYLSVSCLLSSVLTSKLLYVFITSRWASSWTASWIQSRMSSLVIPSSLNIKFLNILYLSSAIFYSSSALSTTMRALSPETNSFGLRGIVISGWGSGFQFSTMAFPASFISSERNNSVNSIRSSYGLSNISWRCSFKYSLTNSSIFISRPPLSLRWCEPCHRARTEDTEEG